MKGMVFYMELNYKKVPYTRRCEIGERLREFRISLGLTQEKMAEILEVSKSHYGQAERGNSNLGEYRLLLLADKLGADITHILTGSGTRKIVFSEYVTECPIEKLFYVEQIFNCITKIL